MYTKFLVRQRSLYRGFCRPFGSASTLNDSMKRSVSSDNQLILPSISTPTSPRMSLEYHKSFRELHVGNPCFLKGGDKAGKENPDISYSIVPRERSHIVSEFLIRYYHQLEPMSLALEMPIGEIGHWFHTFIRMSMYASVTDVSVQAIDENARKRVGVLSSLISDPAIKAPPNLIPLLDPKKHPVSIMIEEFFEKLEEGISEAHYRESSKDMPRVKTLEHMFASIDPDYGGQRITNKMVDVAEAIAATILNCRIGYVVATSEFSYKLFKNQGYEVVKEIKYADYTNSKGEKIFADKIEQMKPHTSCRAMIKQLKSHYD